MKLKFTKFGCGLAVATLTFALAACDDSSSGPSDNEQGLVTNCIKPQSSASVEESSSSVVESSSGVQA